MRVAKIGGCRGDGRAFLKVSVTGDNAIQQLTQLQAEGLVGQNVVPVDVYPVESSRFATCQWIAVFPVLDAPSIKIIISAPETGESGSISVNYAALKWGSRLNYRLRKDLCEQIRDYERTFTHNRYQLSMLRYLEAESSIIWRIRIEWSPEVPDIASMPELSFLDAEGERIDCPVHLFEFQENVKTRDGRTLRRLFVSVETPMDLNNFVIIASDKNGNIHSGFCSMDGRTREGMKYESWSYMKDARADDDVYRSWFASHRVQPGELEGQRASWKHMTRTPLFSIVVPCFKSDAGYLAETLCSVSEQSYGNWEMILVDSSPELDTVRYAVDAVQDDRVKYFKLEGNLGIVGNTNEGIRHARGDMIAFLDHDDVLEPDTLYEYARAVNDNPEAKVIFCDEDSFAEQGRYGQPAFKTQLNVDLLYSHNCVTHFLAVDAKYLNEIGLSAEEVAGAQDYDLVLRALAAGGEFVHVPRVLYHWRIHEGSTNGDNVESKPYAQKAGRIALSRYFDSIGVRGLVEETEHPFVYRMRYELPNPHPLVSVVIPSKDQADMLEGCISSIVRKVTYDNIEIVVVENSSEDPETPERYARIEREYAPFVRTVHWEGAFNYSDIVNYGVSCSYGEYVLLLNNDTKVITPDFIEEMMGYLQRQDVGVVGAKLFFGDGLTQHAGVLVGPHDAVAHVNQDFPAKREGYLGRAMRPGNFSAVTGACQMMRRDVFDLVGGYDNRFAVGFNDVDFCLRVWRAGLRVVFTPYAQLYHYEFVSRGREAADAKKLTRWKREQALFIQTWPELFLDGDPFANPNLDKDSAYYALSADW